MVAIRCSAPPNVDEKAVLPFRFMQMNAAGHPDWSRLAPLAAADCAELRARHPDDAFVHHLSACVALLIGNKAACMGFCSEALLIDPGYADSRTMLDEMLESFGDADDAAIYRRRTGRGLEGPAEAFFVLGHAALEAGDAMAADRLFQRGIALNNPQTSQLLDYAACLAMAEERRAAGTLDAALADRLAAYQRLWATSDDAAAVRNDADLHAAPDRRQLARVVADALAALGPIADGAPATCFEFGCYTGVNLDLVRQEMAGRPDAGPVAFHGLEPNAAAVAYGRQHYPFIALRQGDHSVLDSAEPPLPERLDVALVSRVFQMVADEAIEATLAALRRRARSLVICDDILNLDGDFPVLREPRLIIMQPFRRILAAAGFAVERVVPAEIPERAFSGFIVARAAG